ncbi:MAG: hypothetical protein QUS33_08400 [Dehalococcoidia bacterium]|nr:hypothetical protein [Dehalococcoidia bacterium]
MTLPWSDPTQTLDETERWVVRSQWLTARLLWGALMASLAVYVIIANVAGPDAAAGIETAPGDPWWLVHFPTWLLGAMSPPLLVVAFLIRRGANRPHKFIRQLTGTYMGTAIISWSICESVGIFGLVTFFMKGEFLWLYVFVGVSAVAQVLMRPRKREIIDEVIRTRPQASS